jgi:Flp pilus assembly protein TadB
MDILPFAMGLVMAMFMPSLMASYFDNFEMTMILLLLVVLTIVGSFIIHKMQKNAKGD